MNIDKKIALVSGANRGLGLEISRQLGKLGMHVWLGARDKEEGLKAEAQLRSEGLDATFLQLDITDPATIENALDKIRVQDNYLDVLVNNAAMQTVEGQMPSEISAELLRGFTETNFIGHVLVTQAFLPLLRQSPAGRIVNMSTSLGSTTIMSEPGHINARRNLSGYSSTKAALNMYTVLLAKELKDTNIKVNAADPGWTRTQLGGADAVNTVEKSAPVAVWLATLNEHGPTGGFFGNGLVHPW